MSESVWKFMSENELKITAEVSQNLKCIICHKLMIKACNAPCGCRFCSDCIEHYLNGNDTFCPGISRHCQNRMINYANDIAIDRPINVQISEILVNCPRQNCEFKDELQMMEEHMNNCDKRPISCPFNSIGGEMNEIANEEMNAHLNESNYWHSKLIIDLINNFRNEMESLKNENMELRNNVIELNIKMTELRTENREFKQQIDNIELQSANLQQNRIDELNEMLALKNEYQSMRNEIESNAGANTQIRTQAEVIQTKFERQIDELKQNYELNQQQENKKFQLEIEKCANEIRQIQSIFGYKDFMKSGFFEWEIDKISEQEKREWIYNKPFYSGPFGYKMCLAVIIDFWGKKISVGFHLMRGKFDNKLQWPFEYSVTIGVVEPANRNISHSKSVKYSDSPDHDGWRKPSHDKNDRIDIYGYFNGDYMLIDSTAAKNDKLLLIFKIEKL